MMEILNSKILEVRNLTTERVAQNGSVRKCYAAGVVAEYNDNQSYIQLRGDVAKRFLQQCDRRRHYDFACRCVCVPIPLPGGRTYYENRFYVENFQKTND